MVGVDFSQKMLNRSIEKINRFDNIHIVQADVTVLPFQRNAFDTVTCTHAFYELRGESQHQTLKEIVRVLKPQKPFLMMEHDVPHNFLVKVLFYLRLLSMGTKNAFLFLKHEQRLLRRYFEEVEQITTPSGRSKILICRSSLV